MASRIRITLSLSSCCFALILLLLAPAILRAAPSSGLGLTLQSFFLGKLQGSGTSQDPEHGTRTVVFTGFGAAIPGGLQLTYDAIFSDGEHQHRVWTFMDAGQRHYVGYRDDLIGDAEITQTESDIHMTYKAHVPTKSGTADLSFDEHFTLAPGGTVVDRLTASYFFLNVATGEITIHNAGIRSAAR